jgi:hypothetical protein
MPPWQLLNNLGREGEKLNGALVDVEALEAQHHRLIGSPGSTVAWDLSSKPDGQVHVQVAVKVAVKVKVHVKVKTCTVGKAGG